MKILVALWFPSQYTLVVFMTAQAERSWLRVCSCSEGKYGFGVDPNEERLAKLAFCLIAEDRLDDLKRVSEDEVLREKLFGEFGI